MTNQLEEFIEEYSFEYFGLTGTTTTITNPKCIYEKDLREFFNDKVIIDKNEHQEILVLLNAERLIKQKALKGN